jgi:hypothetical protein
MKAQLALFLFASTLIATSAWPESPDCAFPVIMIPDGRVTQSTFPPYTTLWFGLYAQGGHSYSVEFVPPTDNYAGSNKAQFSSLIVYGPNDSLTGCRGPSSISISQNSGNTPVVQKGGNGTGRRVSFIAGASGRYLVSISNIGNTGSYTFRAVDTTMRWTSFGGYSNQWTFLNRSDMAITGIFVLYDVNNHPLLAFQVNLPPNGEVVRNSDATDLNLPGNLMGYGIFSHDGPDGAVVAEDYMISQSGTQVIHAKFDAIGPK